MIVMSVIIIPLTTATPELIEQARNNVEQWETGISVEVGELYKYDNIIYEVIQSHTTQSGWEPPSVPALFTEYTFQELGEITVFTQPTGAHDAYNLGDRVIVNNIIYESLINDNVWNPREEPTLWENLGSSKELIEQGKSIVIDGNVIYNSYASIVINGSNDLDNIILDNKVIGADKTSSDNNTYELTFFTGNHNVTYGLRNSETNEYREVTSNEGYITTTVNHFSTWTAGIPNIELEVGTNEFESINLENYVDTTSTLTELKTEGTHNTNSDLDFTLITDLTHQASYDTNIYENFLEEDYLWSMNLFRQDIDLGLIDYSISSNDGVTNVETGVWDVLVTLNDETLNVDSFQLTISDNTGGGGSGSLTDATAYYAFDEGTGTTAIDSSVNGNDGTINGATWLSSANAKLGNSALSFDGTNDYVITDSVLTLNDVYSISLWFKSSDTGGGNELVGQWTSTQSDRKFLVRLNNGDIQFFIHDSGSPVSVSDTSSNFADNNWYHVVATTDGSDMRLYVNGVLSDSLSTSDTRTLNQQIVIGEANTNFYTGYMDEIAIYDYALSPSQVEELYNNGDGLNPYDVISPPSQIASISPSPIVVDNFDSADFIELDYDEYFSYDVLDHVVISYELTNGETGTINHTIGESESNARVPSNSSVGEPFTDSLLVDDVRMLYLVNDATPNSKISTWNMQLCNSEGCDDANFVVDVTGLGVTTQTASITPLMIEYEESVLVDIKNYYSTELKDYTLSFEYDLASHTVDNTVNYNGDDFTIIYNGNGVFNITAHNTTIEDLELTFSGLGSRSYSTGDYTPQSTQTTISIEPDVIVEQVASIADLILDYETTGTRNFGDFFTGFNSVKIEFNHSEASHTLETGSTTTYNSSEFDIVLNETTGAVTYYAKTSDVNINILYTATRTGVNSESDNFNLIISDENPVTQVASPGSLNLGYNNTLYYNMGELFNNNEYVFTGLKHNNQEYPLYLLNDTLFLLTNDTVIVSNELVEPDTRNFFQGLLDWLFEAEVYSSLWESQRGQTTYTVDGITFSDSDVVLQMTLAEYTIEGFSYEAVIHSGEHDYEGEAIIGAYRGDFSNPSSINETTTPIVITQEVTETPTTNGGTIDPTTGITIGGTTILPSSESIAFSTAMMIVLFVMGSLLFGAYTIKEQTGVSPIFLNIGTGLAMISAFILFVSLGYIPVWILVLAGLTVVVGGLAIARNTIVGRGV